MGISFKARLRYKFRDGSEFHTFAEAGNVEFGVSDKKIMSTGNWHYQFKSH